MVHRVFELRRYRLVPGGRETLIELFDRQFVETQEAEGIRVIAQFRDRDDPHAFVWLRSFEDMEDRTKALQAFYTGPAWRPHADTANATMVNSDNVLLLRPATEEVPFTTAAATRPQLGEARDRPGIVACTTYSLAPDTQADFVLFFQTRVRSALEQAAIPVDALLTTEKAPNGFRRLPVREGETAFVWFSGFRDESAWEAARARLEQSPEWRDRIQPELDRWLWQPAATVCLLPTARSSYPAFTAS